MIPFWIKPAKKAQIEDWSIDRNEEYIRWLKENFKEWEDAHKINEMDYFAEIHALNEDISIEHSLKEKGLLEAILKRLLTELCGEKPADIKKILFVSLAKVLNLYDKWRERIESKKKDLLIHRIVSTLDDRD